MQIFLNSSEIAALIDKNKYKSQSEAIEDVVCRVLKKKNTRDIDKLECINKLELLELLQLFEKSSILDAVSTNDFKKEVQNCDKDDKIKELSKIILDSASQQSIKTKTTQESVKLQTKIQKNIKKVMKNKNIEKVEEYITGNINKKRGIVNESKIIKELEKKDKIKITGNNECLYKKKLFNIENYEIWLCGKVDGIQNDELIEIKNRKNRLFNMVPIYEKIQFHCYLFLTDMNKGKLVQNWNEEQSIFELNWEIELWNDIINKLNDVSKLIIKQF